MKINYLKLPHCPDNQLVRANPTDAGWDLAAAEDIVIPKYKYLDYETEYANFDILTTLKNTKFIGQYIKFATPESYHYKIYLSTEEDLAKVVLYLQNSLTPYLSFNIISEETKYHYTVVVRNTIEPVEQRLKRHHELVNLDLYSSYGIRFIYSRKKYKPVLVPTGICLKSENLCSFDLRLRSSMIKRGLTMAHGVGTIDFSYNNELFIPVYSISDITYINQGERIAQLICNKLVDSTFKEIPKTEFQNSGRGGFGSSDISVISNQ